VTTTHRSLGTAGWRALVIVRFLGEDES